MATATDKGVEKKANSILITEWINSLELEAETAAQFIKIFNDQEIAMSIVPTLTSNDLNELGITKLGPKKVLLRSIEEMKQKHEKEKKEKERAAQALARQQALEAKRATNKTSSTPNSNSGSISSPSPSSGSKKRKADDEIDGGLEAKRAATKTSSSSSSTSSSSSGSTSSPSTGSKKRKADDEKSKEVKKKSKEKETPKKSTGAKSKSNEPTRKKEKKEEVWDLSPLINPVPTEIPHVNVSISDLHRDLDFRWSMNTDGSITAAPIGQGSFVHVWSGGKATHAIAGGKYWFEFTVLELMDVKIKDDLGLPAHSCRVGWSTVETKPDLLGDDETSFAFESNRGRKLHNQEFQDYGEGFTKDDTIGCFLDLEQSTISFSKNGVWFGVAFTLPDALKGKPLFPHLTLKNMKVKINFGAKVANSPVPQGYQWMENIKTEHALAPPNPLDRPDCEVVFLVGLTLSGKTTWAKKYVQEHDDSHIYILGQQAIYERMKPWLIPDESKSLKKNHKYTETIATLQAAAASGFGPFLKLVPTNPARHYVIDAPNLAEKVRTKRLEYFQGFGKKMAVVVVPSDE